MCAKHFFSLISFRFWNLGHFYKLNCARTIEFDPFQNKTANFIGIDWFDVLTDVHVMLKFSFLLTLKSNSQGWLAFRDFKWPVWKCFAISQAQMCANDQICAISQQLFGLMFWLMFMLCSNLVFYWLLIQNLKVGWHFLTSMLVDRLHAWNFDHGKFIFKIDPQAMVHYIDRQIVIIIAEPGPCARATGQTCSISLALLRIFPSSNVRETLFFINQLSILKSRAFLQAKLCANGRI